MQHNTTLKHVSQVAIVGAGPAGLMAAEVISQAGLQVHVYDAKPSAGRKFLLAGVGGMNITHAEPFDTFIQRYYEQSNWLKPIINAFNAQALTQWIHDLGIETFIGSSGRIFPKEMKAAPLLRRWLQRLRTSGVTFHMKHRLVAIDQENHNTRLAFNHLDQIKHVNAEAVILAMGGASWPKLGSDGAWQHLLKQNGIKTNPLLSANCGFHASWSQHLKTNFAGQALKNVAFSFTTLAGQFTQQTGECIISHYGIEGSLVYAFSKHLRDSIQTNGSANLTIDLLPQYTTLQIQQKLSKPRGKNSLAKHLKRTVGITGVKSAMLYECHNNFNSQPISTMAHSLKNTVVKLTKTRPLNEAISTAGGICKSNLNNQLMLTQMPGVFCAGEMLDWEAPTGGYLLTACFATGQLAGMAAVEYLNNNIKQ